jgi:hypothetical protein
MYRSVSCACGPARHPTSQIRSVLYECWQDGPQSIQCLFGGLPNGAHGAGSERLIKRYPCRCRANVVSKPIVRAQDQSVAAVSASQTHGVNTDVVAGVAEDGRANTMRPSGMFRLVSKGVHLLQGSDPSRVTKYRGADKGADGCLSRVRNIQK